MKKVSIYTDGACSGNPGKGGWAAILVYKRNEKEISGYEDYSTNNRMELTAVIEAFKLVKESCEITVFSDSTYVCNAFQNHWINKWLTNGWKTASGKVVENTDLWLELLALMHEHEVKYEKVSGHSDNDYNNRCDKLARDAIKHVQ